MGEDSGAPSRSRKLLLNGIKITLGLTILVVIAFSLDLDDTVRVAGTGGESSKVLEGRDLSVSGVWKLEALDGKQLPDVPWNEYPILEKRKRDGALRISIGDQDPTLLASATLSGTFELRPDASADIQVHDLEKVRFDDGKLENGWVENLPAIREGLVTIFRRLTVGRYTLAMLLIFAMYCLGILRWTLLLRAQSLPVPLSRAFQLTFIGFFFNNIVPGLTGGDVVKAVMIARDHPGRGAAAVGAVIADRVIGILVLAFMSAGVLLFTFSRYETAGTAIFLFLGTVAAVILLFFSRRVRRGLRINELLRRLPGSGLLMKLEEAFLLYRERKKIILVAMGLSLVAHFCNILAIYLMGMDLGVTRSAGLQGEPLIAYFATVPIILIASSIPLLPGGWGLGELMYGYFFRTVGIRNLGLSVGLSVLSRASMMIWSLLGGVFLVLHRKEARDAIRQSELE